MLPKTRAFRIPVEIWSRIARASREQVAEKGRRGRAKSPERVAADLALSLGLIFVTDAEVDAERLRKGHAPEVLNISGRNLRLVRAREGNAAATVRAALVKGLDLMDLAT